jgi:predicted metal-dependent peptidase
MDYKKSVIVKADRDDPNSFDRKALKEADQMIRDMIDPAPAGFVCASKAYVDGLCKTNSLDITTLKKQEEEVRSVDLMAYTYRSYRGKYTIFIKDGVSPEAFEMLDLHEKGHIVLNHTHLREMHEPHFAKVIEAQWNKVKKHFADTALKNYSKEKLVRYLYDKFANIAQDMQINSIYFENWPLFRSTIYREELLSYVRDLEHYFDQGIDKLSTNDYRKFADKFLHVRAGIELKTLGTIDGKPGPEKKFGNDPTQISQYCHPSHEGWPEKLDWMIYMQLMINDIENWAGKVAAGYGSGRPLKNPNGTGDKSGENKSKIDGDDVTDDAEQKKEMEKNDEEVQDGDFQDDDFDLDSGKGSGHDGGVVGYVAECTKFDELIRILREKCLQKKSRRLHTDVLYNTNRNKHHGVVIPRRQYREKWVPGSIIILLDVSGSVPTDLVTKVIKSIVNTTGVFDPKGSRLIQWDTELCSDTLLSEKKIEINRGGGTEMADGIAYCGKYMRTSLDRLFVLSDFEDELSKWITEGRKVRGYKCAIGYRVNRSQSKDEWLAEKLSGYRGSSELREDFLNIFDTVLLSINRSEMR